MPTSKSTRVAEIELVAFFVFVFHEVGMQGREWIWEELGGEYEQKNSHRIYKNIL